MSRDSWHKVVSFLDSDWISIKQQVRYYVMFSHFLYNSLQTILVPISLFEESEKFPKLEIEQLFQNLSEINFIACILIFFRFKHLKTKGWTNYLSFSCMVISFECFSKIFQQASLSRRPHQSWMSHLHNSLPQRTLTNKTGRRWKIKNSSATSVLFRENIISWPFSHCVSDKNCRKHWPAPPSTRWSK